MQGSTVLLLRPDSPCEFAVALRDVFNSVACPSHKLTYNIVERRAADLWDDETARLLRSRRPEVCVLVLTPSLLGRADALLPLIISESPTTQVVIGAEDVEPEQMVRLFELGAADFITPPLRVVDILPRVWRLTAERAEPAVPAAESRKGHGLKQLIGSDPEFLAVVNKVPSVAKCGASVLILGETGTGKGLCARAIHYLSPRAGGPFVSVNCGALPTELVENELFGHERGAFTGAAGVGVGLIREADGGTLFLDEVDCLPSQAQVKLLRFLQDKEYKPLGSAKLCSADVRIIAATNADCQAAILSGRLRQDFYFRLNVIPLKLPPLRERRADIMPLAHHFLAKYAAEFGKQARDFSAGAGQTLVNYDWPGNVRELEHVVERAVVFSEQPTINDADLVLSHEEEHLSLESFKEAKARLIMRFEKAYIRDLLVVNHGNVSKAARAARKNRRSLWQLIRKHQIDVDCIRSWAK
jgi:DNA-binding NtrC family response regulator